MGKKSSAVYNINYHIVWPELRQADPFDSPTNIVKIFKGVTGLRISTKSPEIECEYGMV